jgi:hypothetical protein
MHSKAVFHIGILATLFSTSQTMGQGALTPSSGPAPGMKTLQQIEPRIPISSTPVVLNASGSYYLTTNLAHTAASDAIQINAANVTLDLGGWVLSGQAGTGDGISVNTFATNFIIFNGAIRNFASRGIDALGTPLGTVERVEVSANGSSGILIGPGATIVECIARLNAGNGIQTGSDSRILRTRAEDNGSTGLSGGDGSWFEDCVSVRQNSGLSGRNLSVFRCTAKDNIFGFSLTDGCLVADSVALTNTIGFSVEGPGALVRQSRAQGNSQSGFSSTSGVTFEDCAAEGNLVSGFDSQSQTRYIGCAARSNGRGFGSGGASEFVNVLALGSTNAGIYLSGNDSIIRSSTIVSNASYGISTSSNSVISDCLIADNGLGGGTISGILLRGSRNRIDNNTVLRNGPYGIFYGFLANVTNNVITRNHVAGHTTANISMPNGNHFVIVSVGNLATNLNPYVNFSLP